MRHLYYSTYIKISTKMEEIRYRKDYKWFEYKKYLMFSYASLITYLFN